MTRKEDSLDGPCSSHRSVTLTDKDPSSDRMQTVCLRQKALNLGCTIKLQNDIPLLNTFHWNFHLINAGDIFHRAATCVQESPVEKSRRLCRCSNELFDMSSRSSSKIPSCRNSIGLRCLKFGTIFSFQIIQYTQVKYYKNIKRNYFSNIFSDFFLTEKLINLYQKI